jgi:hypothetical protein
MLIALAMILNVIAMLLLVSCVSGPQMPTAPLTCYDNVGKEIPCVEEMDCH